MAPFDEDFQKAVIANKVALDKYYPTTTALIDLPACPSITFDFPPLEVDDDNTIQPAIGEICATAEILGDCYIRQVPLPRIPNNQKPSLGSKPLPQTPITV